MPPKNVDILKFMQVEIQTNREPNCKCQVIYYSACGVTHYHPLISLWKNIIIKEKSIFITIREKENRPLWFRLKTSLLDHVSALAGSSKACFLFGPFSGWILNHLGVLCKGCDGLVFTFKEPKGHGEHVHVQEAYRILKARI